MAKTQRSGRANQLTGQVGEYRVAAELARRGLIATTFTGNVPHFDIVASDAQGRHVSVQVKTSNSPSWQFSVDDFCSVRLSGKRQVVGSLLRAPVRRLVVVMVLLGVDGNPDRFFVCPWTRLRNILVGGHRDWLQEHGGVRPKNPRSMHTVVAMRRLLRYENRWGTVTRSLR